MAEWLRRGLQNLVHRFKSGRCLHIRASGGIGIRGGLKIRWLYGLEGSSPSSPTILALHEPWSSKTEAKRLVTLLLEEAVTPSGWRPLLLSGVTGYYVKDFVRLLQDWSYGLG